MCHFGGAWNPKRGLDLKHGNQSKLKVVLIDFDGTLVDSMEDLYGIYFAFLREYGHEGTPEEFAELNGPTINEILAMLMKKYHLPEPLEKLLEIYKARLEEYYGKTAVPYPGVVEFLMRIRKEGIKSALVTSAKRSFVDPFLKRHHLEQYFSHIVTADGVSHGKPNPEIYLKALQVLGIQPSEALAIEDSLNGVLSATSAGIYTWRINSKLSNEPDIKSHDSRLELPNWKSIEELFTETYG